ncbi:MAG: hypothetical protein ACO25L_02895 [Candidatus Nanopelagicales bacterium]
MSEHIENPDNQVEDSTAVGQVDVNIDEIFGMPGAENVMLPASEEEKPKSMFSKEEKVDTSFFDKKSNSEKSEDETRPEEIESTINELNDLITQEEDAGNKGRPKVDKSGLYDLAIKMIDEGTLIPFEDDKPLEEYTTKDFRELFEANFQEREEQIRRDTPREFFNALPEELQVAAKYVADGGTDLKGLFRTLAHVEEMRQLDPSDEHDQAEIARQYLYATQFGTPEEIEDEIQDWKDLNRLEQKANQFKPKLDAMQAEIVQQQLEEQEERKKLQAEQAKAYQENVYGTLATGSIGGIKLDKKIQSLLFSGLVQPNYPSISGKPTNLLGHLLEKYQFVEPRHDLIAEALWLLADPNGYKNRVREQGSKQATEKVVKQLKTEQSRKLASSGNNQYDDEPRRPSAAPQPKKLIKNNLFKRF